MLQQQGNKSWREAIKEGARISSDVLTPEQQTVTPPAEVTRQAVVNLDLLQEEYGALHSEITQRLDGRQGALTFTLQVAAAFLGFGLQGWASSLTALAYPPLALFLALMWYQHDKKIGEIATYLRQIEDDHLGYPGWETWRRSHFRSTGRAIELPAQGIFLLSEALAMLVGLARFLGQANNGATTILFACLMAVDLVALMVTQRIVKHERKR